MRRNRKLEGLLLKDLRRAVGLADGSWEPRWNSRGAGYVFSPTADDVVRILDSMHGRKVAYDIETNGEHPCSPKLEIRCCGFWDGKQGVCVPWLYRNGTELRDVFDKKGKRKKKQKAFAIWAPYFSGGVLKKVNDAVQRLFNRASSLITQNGQYDRLCLRKKFGFTAPRGPPHFDTILAHHIVAPYLPHGLDLLASVYAEMPYYKKTEEGHAWSTSSDRELWLYCLRGDVRVVMADGSRRKISALVRAKSHEKVLSMSLEGKLEARHIVGWHRNRVKGQKWIQISTKADVSDGMTVTPEHEIWVRLRGWVRAKDVKVGDELALSERRLTHDQQSALMGTMLGDSTLSVSPSFRASWEMAPTAAVRGNHRADTRLSQEKVRLLGDVATLDPQRKGTIVQVEGRVGKGRPSQPWRTKNLAQLAFFLPHLYDVSGKKRLSLAIVQRMGAVGWAWWFMDDGCVQKGQRKSRNTGVRGGRKFARDTVALSTQCFSHKDIDAVVEWMRTRFGPTIAGCDKVIRLGVRASAAFCREIAPYVLPTQRYKLPRETSWPAYRDFETRLTNEPVYSRVREVRPWKPKRQTRSERHRADTRWCLDVEGNHNFFTQYGLVHNCLRDCEATWVAAEKLRVEVVERAADAVLYKHDARQEAECEDWKGAGIEVDEEALALFQQHYKAVATKAMAKMKKLFERALEGTLKRKEVTEAEYKEAKAKLDAVCDPKHKPSGTGTTDGQRRGEENRALGITKPIAAVLTLEQLFEKLKEKADEEETDELGGAVERFNPASLVHLRSMLIDIGIPLSEETATGQLSTAKEFLHTARKSLIEQKVSPKDDRLAFLDALFAWRQSIKVEGTYLRPVLIDAGYTGVNGTPARRIHPTFSVHVVPTGRLASKEPNFQNQPPSIRGMYVARLGHVFVYIDWDALEMRLGAFMSGDQTFIEDFKKWDTRTGPKIHIVNMCNIFNLPLEKGIEDKHPGCYRAAKVFAYAVAYGAGEATVYEQVREAMPDMDFPTFKKVFATYKEFRKQLFVFQKDVVRRGVQNQYLDSTIMERRVFFFEKVFGEDSPEASAMQNMPYQSTGSDVVELANFRVLDKVVRPMQAKLKPGEVLQQLAQVHDELLFEVPERLAEAFLKDLKRVAEEPPGAKFKSWSLPVTPGTSKRWKPIKWKCQHCAEKLKSKVELELEKKGVVLSIWTGKCDVCKKTTKVEVTKQVAAPLSKGIEHGSGEEEDDDVEGDEVPLEVHGARKAPRRQRRAGARSSRKAARAGSASGKHRPRTQGGRTRHARKSEQLAR